MPLQKAFVWAAGLGTRLRPYTHETPKPLLDLYGRPLLEYVLRYLAHAGVTDVTANVWHLGEQFEPMPERAAAFGVNLSLSRQPQRFEHGGDLAFAQDFLAGLGADEPFLGLNGDTLFYIPPDHLRRAAERVSPDAPVLLFTQPSEANPLRIHEGRVVGVGGVRYEEVEPTGRADDFGVRVFHASVRDFLVEPPQTDAFHGREGLLGRITAAGKRVPTEPVRAAAREEVGTVEDYEGRAENAALRALTERLAALP
ncbi:MAG: NDP-sugar synthase [Rhodothermales bacterium]|nr:NDP-sugar synthase [Rhodothermales bacterium]